MYDCLGDHHHWSHDFQENNPKPALGIFMLRVVSVVTDSNGETSVASTATSSDIQLVNDGLVIRCRESFNLTHANNTLSVTSELLCEGLQVY